MNLNELLYPWIQKHIPKINILGICLNSNFIKYNEVFLAIKGNILHGKDFIKDAIRNGASSVILECSFIKDHGNIIYFSNIPIIFFYNLKKYISSISGNFYNNPSKKINVIGVTGTNGKTTVTFLISRWLKLIGEKSYIVSTLGNGDIDDLYKTNNTTDSAIDMQKEIYKTKNLYINYFISEISSHSIVQYRVKSINFKSAILTNIKQDHLDFHKSLKNYRLSKLSFFINHKIESSIINIDDKLGKFLSKKINNVSKVSLNIIKNPCSKNWIYPYKIVNFKDSTQIFFNSNFGESNIKINFFGDFNINNLLLSMVTLLDLGFLLSDLVKTSIYLKLPPGRMDIYNKKDKKIIIDYAHTSDSMEKVLKVIKNKYLNNKIWCIFGCGGNRDKKKRPIMGFIAEKYSNKIILTNDNPRNENPELIIKNILQGISIKNKIIIIYNRKKAIKYAFYKSSYDDIIIIFGKGHENYQIFKNKNIFHSDIKLIKNIIKCD